MIAFSTLCYTLGKMMGPKLAAQQFHAWLEAGVSPLDCISSYHAVRAAAVKEEVLAMVDTGATHLGKARSRQFHWARTYRDDAEPRIWMMCDDDVAISTDAAAHVLAALSAFEPRVVIVPTVLRGSEEHSGLTDLRGRAVTTAVTVDVAIDQDRPISGSLVPITAGGCGFFAMNRPAMTEIAEHCYSDLGLEFLDDDGALKLALFLDEFEGRERGRWWGEDLSFWRRIPPTVQRYAIAAGQSSHAGTALDCEAWGRQCAEQWGRL